jgi:hypothetical protein
MLWCGQKEDAMESISIKRIEWHSLVGASVGADKIAAFIEETFSQPDYTQVEIVTEGRTIEFRKGQYEKFTREIVANAFNNANYYRMQERGFGRFSSLRARTRRK